MSSRTPRETFTRVDIKLIDEPELAMRETIDQHALAELAADIKVNGIVQPLRLSPREGRYVIVAGHRRFLAAMMSNLSHVPAIVKVSTRAEIEAIKVAENSYREEVNPAEEGAYYARLLDECCGGDVDVLCAMVRKTRTVVESRLLLLQGDPEVLAAVKERVISLGVASELNLIDDASARLTYLQAARRGGASVRMVREWRAGYERLKALQAGEPPPAEHYEPPPPQPAGSTLSCFVCDSNEDPHELDLVYMHRSCRRLIVNKIMQQVQGKSGPDTPKG